MPLKEALAIERSTEITQHLRDELRTLATQCALRRSPSKPTYRLGRPGRPKKAISIPLLADLEPFLKDDSYALAKIAELFGMSVGELQFYGRRLGIRRKRGRKARVEKSRAA